MDSFLIGLTCFGSPILLLLVLTFVAGALTGREWRRFARAHGMIFLPVRLWRSRHRLQGDWEGRPVIVEVRQVGRLEFGLSAEGSAVRSIMGSERLTVVRIALPGMPHPRAGSALSDVEALRNLRDLPAPVVDVLAQVRGRRPSTWLARDELLVGARGVLQGEGPLRGLLDDAVAAARDFEAALGGEGEGREA